MKRLLSGLLAAMLLLASTPALAEGDFSDRFPDKFLAPGKAPVITATSYQSEHIAIEITSQRYAHSDVYVADIYIRSMDCFTRYYAQGNWHKSKNAVPTMAAESGAILAITGDSSQNFKSGWVIGNGAVERDGTQPCNTKRDLFIVYKNGEARAVTAPTKAESAQIGEETENIWHIFLFGPSLLDEEGNPYSKKSFEERVQPHAITYVNPRSALGYIEPGHYCFVQVDGRDTKSKLEAGQKNSGVRLEDLAALMQSLGCKAAYNLDGGRSSMLWFLNGLVSTPAATNRQIGDILVIAEPE